MMNFADIENSVSQFAKLGDIPAEFTKIFHESPQDGTPHIEITPSGYEYVVQERGFEFSRRSTHDPDELLFWIFDDISSNYAFTWELSHRKPGNDSRRLAFSMKETTLKKINLRWWRICQKNIFDILEKNPFIDN